MGHLIGTAVCISALFLAGCANVAISHIPYQPDSMQQRKLAVFLDGTANDEGSHTNIAKLHNLVRLQSRVTISTTYIKGVGVDFKILGMAMGWGIGQDVRQAYRYLAENYRHKLKDEIYIFGFSRGAYAARILAALINVAGIPDVRGMKNKERIKYIEEIYSAYKSSGRKLITDRRTNVAMVLKTPYRSVHIKFMGLWETIEALGWPDYTENIDVPNHRYADQLCNVDKAAHALAIDDDRADIFTPILLTRWHLIEECKEDIKINKVVTEVWFSGAHSDVGGGYKNTEISGVSLNWMIGQIKEADQKERSADNVDCSVNCQPPTGLLPTNAAVYSDFAGRTHDPEGDFLWGLLYEQKNRNLTAYTEDKRKYLGGKLKIHKSVVNRLAMCKVQSYESHWFLNEPYETCFTPSGKKSEFFEFNRNDNKCMEVLEVVDPKYENFNIIKCGNFKENPEKDKEN